MKRVEVGVLPATVNADKVAGRRRRDDPDVRPESKQVRRQGLHARSRRLQKCESCHAALATTFHEPSYGGSVTACRMCHIVKSGGSHLEMQSRSLDSYVHAIHSIPGVRRWRHQLQGPGPGPEVRGPHRHAVSRPTTIGNCESCHVKGTYDVPDQAESLPGILSASAKNETWDRKIGTVPSVVTGPATKACGGCHRADLINEDKAGGLAVLNKHFAQGGYLVPAGDKPLDTWKSVINQVMSLFK